MCSLSVSFLIGVYAVSALGLPCTPSSSCAVHGTVTRHRHGTWTRHELRHTTMKLRGGSETEAAVTDETKDAPVGFAAQLYSALKENKSLDPNDHPTSLQWALAGSYEWTVYKFSFKVYTFGEMFSWSAPLTDENLCSIAGNIYCHWRAAGEVHSGPARVDVRRAKGSAADSGSD